MILVDTSVWIQHFRNELAPLVGLLESGNVLGQAWVTGELALGNLSQRQEVISLLAGLPQALTATADEVLTLIEGERLYGSGIGLVDAHLLAATRLTSEASLWTADRRLSQAASRLGVAYVP